MRFLKTYVFFFQSSVGLTAHLSGGCRVPAHPLSPRGHSPQLHSAVRLRFCSTPSLGRRMAHYGFAPGPAQPGAKLLCAAAPRHSDFASLIQDVSVDHFSTKAGGAGREASADKLFTAFNYHRTDLLNFLVT